ncbi:spermatogenesis-associated protein 31D1 [Sorex fumeus]|uniref:spermatogenesis-associated protein 31D1 n=1 Tax=Sorex fumeus TaxID=62283 RepID=UPI0024ACB36F|nr:spermatogenesis-associated protein 31D1 [Sorex fumeus]
MTATEVTELLDPRALVDGVASVALMTGSSINLCTSQSIVPSRELTWDSSALPCPPSPHSIRTQHPRIPLTDCILPTLPSGSLPSGPFPALDPEFHLDHCSSFPLSFSPFPSYETQTVDPAVPHVGPLSYQHPGSTLISIGIAPLQDINLLPNYPDNALTCHQSASDMSVSAKTDVSFTVTKSKSFSILLSSQENPAPGSPGELSKGTPTITVSEQSSLEITKLPWSQTQSKNTFSSTLPASKCDQECIAPPLPNMSFGEDIVISLVEPGHHSFVSPKSLLFLESHIQRRISFLTLKGYENRGNTSLKPLCGDNQLESSGKILTTNEQDNSTEPLPSWPNIDLEYQGHDPPLVSKMLNDHCQKKYTHLFWGLPSLHSESLPLTLNVLRDSFQVFIFNLIQDNTTCKKSSVHPHYPPVPLCARQLPELPRFLSPSKSLCSQAVKTLNNVISPLKVLPSGSQPQNRICGVRCHLPHNDPVSLTTCDIQHLEHHILQKKQEYVWGLPSIVQRSQQEFYPSVPKIPDHRNSLVHTSVSILQGNFPLSMNLTKKLEHHLHKRLIQHQWGQPCTIHGWLSQRMPPEKFSEKPELPERGSNNEETLSPLSMGHNSTNRDLATSQPENIHHPSIDTKMGKENIQSSDKMPKYHLSDQEKSSEVGLKLQSDQFIKDGVLGMSENNTQVVGKNQSTQSLELVLKTHLSKKFEEIHEGRLPGSVTNSRRTSKVTLSTSQKSLTPVKQRKSTLAEGEQGCLNTVQDLPFFDSKARKLMETHINRFHKQMIWGLPTRVCESIECCKLSTTSSCFNMPSLTNWYSKGRAKSRNFNPSKQNAEFLQGDGTGIKCLNSSVGHAVSDLTSSLQKDRQSTPKQSPVVLRNALNEEIQTLKTGKIHLMSVKNNPIQKENLSESLPVNPNLPARQDQARQESKIQHVKFSHEAEMPCDLSKPQTPRETHQVKKQPALLSKAQKHMTIKRVDTSPKASAMKDAESDVVAGSAPIKPPFSHHFTVSPLKCQLIDEPKITLKNKKECEAKDQSQSMSQSSDELTYKTSVTQLVGVHGNLGISPALHVQLKENEVRLEGQQESWLPKHVLRQCPDEALPRAPGNVCSCPASKSEELGAGDAHLGKADGGRKICPSKVKALQETQGSKTCQVPLQRRPPPSENYYSKRVKGCFQWISPRTKIQSQESSQEMYTPISSVSNMGLIQMRAAPLGKNENPRTTTDSRKSPREKVGHVPPVDGTCPQKPSPTPVKFKAMYQVAEVQVQRRAVQEHCLKEEIPSQRVATTKSYQPEAGYVPQRCPRHNRYIPSKASLQKAMACKDQHVGLKDCPSMDPSQARDSIAPAEKGTLSRDVPSN